MVVFSWMNYHLYIYDFVKDTRIHGKMREQPSTWNRYTFLVFAACCDGWEGSGPNETSGRLDIESFVCAIPIIGWFLANQSPHRTEKRKENSFTAKSICRLHSISSAFPHACLMHSLLLDFIIIITILWTCET